MFDAICEFLSAESDYDDYVNFTDDDAWLFLPSEIVGDFDSVESLCD